MSSGYNVAAPSSTSFSRLPYQNPHNSPRNTRYFGNCVNDKSARFNTLVASRVNRVRPAEGRGGRVYVGQCEAHSVTCDLAPDRDHTSEYSQHLQNPTVTPASEPGRSLRQWAHVATSYLFRAKVWFAITAFRLIAHKCKQPPHSEWRITLKDLWRLICDAPRPPPPAPPCAV